MLTLQYSGTNNFNPSASGQNGSPAGPTLTVVSLMPSLQSVTLQSCSAKLQGMRLPLPITSQHPSRHSAQVSVQISPTGTTVSQTVVPTSPAGNAPVTVSGGIYPSDGSNPVGTITIAVSLPPCPALQRCRHCHTERSELNFAGSNA